MDKPLRRYAAGLNVSSAHSHGVVGKRTFLEPFVTEDANPKNEFVIAKPGFFHTDEGNEFSLGFALEKKLSDNFSLVLEEERTSQRVGGKPNADGFQNPGILLKYSLWKDPSREFILSLPPWKLNCRWVTKRSVQNGTLWLHPYCCSRVD